MYMYCKVPWYLCFCHTSSLNEAPPFSREDTQSPPFSRRGVQLRVQVLRLVAGTSSSFSLRYEFFVYQRVARSLIQIDRRSLVDAIVAFNLYLYIQMYYIICNLCYICRVRYCTYYITWNLYVYAELLLNDRYYSTCFRYPSQEDGMVNLSLQTWTYAEFVFSSYLYVVYYICNFNLSCC